MLPTPMAPLVDLDLDTCEDLMSLPEVPLRVLKRLSINGCPLLRRLPKCSAPGQLHLLIISHCGLRSLPKNLGSLANLRTLRVCHCKELYQVPESIGSLRQLTYLNLRGCNIPDYHPQLVAFVSSPA